VRTVVEAIYEPPQVGELHGVRPLEDRKKSLVDQVAKALDMTHVGWIFTSSNAEVFLSANEVLDIAKLQEQHTILHPSGARISKFVTVKAKFLNEKGETGLEAFMVSDQCQALVRDNIFSGPKDDNTLLVRQPAR
jgi:nuclear protein localization family protein 4